VAEVMLQQTQVSTVVPYFRSWMDHFPTIQSLAEATQDEVLKQWEGLGYYSRARNLHEAAQIVMDIYEGQLPRTAEELIRLPGIGLYTSGAIASIVYNQAVPAVDGNVIRILSRVKDMTGDTTKEETKKQMWSLAADLQPLARPGDFNQAMMELGQTVCLSASPVCHKCPVADYCLALQRGTQLQRPVRPKRPELPHYQVTAGIICREDGRFLIAKRPAKGLLGGMWEFPGGKQENSESLKGTLRREIMEELGIEITVSRKLIAIEHAYTHFRITLHAYFAKLQEGKPQNLQVADHAWVELSDLEKYPFATADKKIIEKLASESRSTGSSICD
jgi:A/G-specific adenine glycosylase